MFPIANVRVSNKASLVCAGRQPFEFQGDWRVILALSAEIYPGTEPWRCCLGGCFIPGWLKENPLDERPSFYLSTSLIELFLGFIHGNIPRCEGDHGFNSLCIGSWLGPKVSDGLDSPEQALSVGIRVAYYREIWSPSPLSLEDIHPEPLGYPWMEEVFVGVERWF